eukprot:gene10852-biopygen6543
MLSYGKTAPFLAPVAADNAAHGCEYCSIYTPSIRRDIKDRARHFGLHCYSCAVAYQCALAPDEASNAAALRPLDHASRVWITPSI